MYYPEELVEEIREKNDIVDVISSYVKLKKQGSSYFGLCPFHNEKSPSFSVSPYKQMFYCFGCGEGGNVISFIMKYENYTFPEAVQYLAERVGVVLPEINFSEEAKKQADIRTQILEVNKEAAKYYYRKLYDKNEPIGYHYFKGRELSDEIITKFGLGFTGKNGNLYGYLKSKGFKDEILKETGLFKYEEKAVYDRFWNRVMFPIMDVNNRVIGFGGRVMGDAKPKYVNSPETRLFDKSRNMYGMNLARISRKNYMLVCEGYMDVISLHQAGFNNAVAALGTSFTSGHASLIKKYVNSVVLTFDSDEAGCKATLRAIPILKEAGLSIKVLDMKPYKDPDEFIKAFGVEEYQKRIDNAKNYFLFQMDMLKRNYDLNAPDGKTDFYNAVAGELAKFGDELERNNYTEAVSREQMIPLDGLKRLVNAKALNYAGGDGNTHIGAFSEEKKLKNKLVKDDGVVKAQQILLTWLIEEPALFRKVEPYISTEDFADPLFRQIAGEVFEQLKEGKVNPAKILDKFESEEEHRIAARIFNSPLSEELSKNEKERALNDTIIKIKTDSIDSKAANVTDIAEMQQIIIEKAKLQKLHISL